MIARVLAVVTCVIAAEARSELLSIEQIKILPDAVTGVYIPLTAEPPGLGAFLTVARRHGLSVLAGLAERKAELWGGKGWTKLAAGPVLDLSAAFQSDIPGFRPNLGFMLDKDLGPGGAFGGAIFVRLTVTRPEDLLAILTGLLGGKREGE